FIGKAALRRLAARPPRRRATGLFVDGPPMPPNEEPWPLTVAGRPAGRLTSLAHSPRLERNIAIGLVDAALAEPGTRMEVETWTGPRIATATPLPFLPKRQSGDVREMCAAEAR
ncbi:MAG: glycine cleavage T C-terminal barrel domain-containing protein, partial [Pseudomonadota bacterium]